MSHALLSPSAAHRWLNCTAAPKYEQQFPDSTSEYAAEGTLAHSVAELRVTKYAVSPMSSRSYNIRLNKLKKDPLWQDEMLDHTETYLDYIKSIVLRYNTLPYVAVERKLDMGLFAPGSFGTADCIIAAGDTLFVIDFKYGKGVAVSADHNPQMMMYALGAIQEYRLIYGITKVCMAIVQPRINNISEFEMPVSELVSWGKEKVTPAATEAVSAGKFKPGEHCRFCRGKMQCKARNAFYAAQHEVMAQHPAPTIKDTISLAELGGYLPIAKQLKSWADDLLEYALSRCLAGDVVPGWKAVEGRGSRAFTDMDAAFKVLMDNKYDEAVLYERVPLTLAKCEKLVGPKRFGELVGGFITKNAGKPALAPESDKRPAISNQIKAADVFTNLEESVTNG